MTTSVANSRHTPIFLILLLVAIMTGCSSKIVVPPVTMDAARLQLNGKFVWYDLFTTDMTASQNFYDRVFDWTFERTNEGNPRVKNIMFRGQFIGNMIGRDSTPGDSQWLSYMSVGNVDGGYDAALAAGASGQTAPKELPNRGRIAVIVDPQKAPVALLKSPVGDPADARATPSLWIGAELWTVDVDQAVTFYTRLAQFQVQEIAMHEKVAYRVLLTNNRIRAGIVSIPWEGVTPQWIPYVGVEDISAAVERVKGNGGRILVDPQPAIKAGRVAIFADPSGAVMGIQGSGTGGRLICMQHDSCWRPQPCCWRYSPFQDARSAMAFPTTTAQTGDTGTTPATITIIVHRPISNRTGHRHSRPSCRPAPHGQHPGQAREDNKSACFHPKQVPLTALSGGLRA